MKFNDIAVKTSLTMPELAPYSGFIAKGNPLKKRKIHHLRWYIGGLLVTATIINYIDRQTLSVSGHRIKLDLHLSQIQYGHAVQMFLLAYTVFYVLSGFLVDRWGTRKSLVIFDAWWSVANMLHMFARSALSLSFFSFLLGMGEPGVYNAASRAASEWFPPKERAFVNGLVNAGSAAGAVLATPLVAWLILGRGWRFAFLATGLLGLAWLIPWCTLYFLPEKHPALTQTELAYIREGQVERKKVKPPGIGTLLQRRDIWGLMLARFFSDPVWWFYLFWMPSFLQEQRGLSLLEVAALGWMPYFVSGVGGLLGGWISDALVLPGRSPVRARLLPMAFCAFAMPMSLLIPKLHSIAGIIVVLCAMAFSHMAWKTNLMTITNDIYPTECIGTVSGILMVGSGVGGFLFQGITALFAQHSSYAGVFAIMGFMHPAAFVVCYLTVRNAPPASVPQLVPGNSRGGEADAAQNVAQLEICTPAATKSRSGKS